MPGPASASDLFSYIYKWGGKNCGMPLPEKRVSCLASLRLDLNFRGSESVTSRNASQSEYRRRYPLWSGAGVPALCDFCARMEGIRTH